MADASLVGFMDAVVTLEREVHEDLPVFRWRPLSADLPMIYNGLGDSPFEYFSQAHARDRVMLLPRIAVRHTDSADDHRQLEVYADAFRAVVDAALNANPPFDGAADRAQRTGMRVTFDSFDRGPALVMEFQIEAWLDRVLPPH